jgi:hypothetical protein
MVGVEGVEPSILSAAHFKCAAYAVPPHSHMKWSPLQDSNL